MLLLLVQNFTISLNISKSKNLFCFFYWFHSNIRVNCNYVTISICILIIFKFTFCRKEVLLRVIKIFSTILFTNCFRIICSIKFSANNCRRMICFSNKSHNTHTFTINKLLLQWTLWASNPGISGYGRVSHLVFAKGIIGLEPCT